MTAVILLVALVLVVQHCLLLVYKSSDSPRSLQGMEGYLRSARSKQQRAQGSSIFIRSDNGEARTTINMTNHDRFHGDHNHDSFLSDRGGTGQASLSLTRVAVIIVYIGDAFPSWFDTFCFSLQASSPLFDYFFFVTEASMRQVPTNVNIIRITRDNLVSRMVRLDDGTNTNSQASSSSSSSLSSSSQHNGESDHSQDFFKAFQTLLEIEPYVLVEFKPCLGFLFEDYIKDYSHWAFADLDTLLGRAHSLVTPQILKNVDVYTASFGDNFRFYTRGQLTIHRNDPYINNLWRSCSHLSQINKRLASFVAKGSKGWNFESAEGCYSRVVADHENVSVLVGSTQISDAFSAPLNEKESFLLGNSVMRCYEKGIPPLSSDNPAAVTRVTDFLMGNRPDYFTTASSSSSTSSSNRSPLLELIARGVEGGKSINFSLISLSRAGNAHIQNINDMRL